MKLLQEFREFAMKGNVVDLAVGVIIGAAFGAVVSSFVANVMMPPLGYLVSGVDFEELSIDIPVGKVGAAVGGIARSDDDGVPEEDVDVATDEDQVLAPDDESAETIKGTDPVTGTVGEGADKVVRIMYGKFLNDVIKFVIQAFAVFMVIKAMNRIQREKDAAAEQPGPVQQPELSTEERLLTEIRDLMAAGAKPDGGV